MWRGSFQPPAAGGTRQHVESFSSLAIRLLGWYYQARAAGTDRVGALRKRVRKDAGTHRAVTPALGSLLRAQYDDHPTWSYQLHADNLVVLCEQD